MNEPKRIIKGDSVAWSRVIANASRTYQYILVGPDSKFTIDATVDNGFLDVNLTSDKTKSFQSGEYRWHLFSDDGTDRFNVAHGYLVIDANPHDLEHCDTSSHAERVLRAIEKRIEGRILSDHENYSVDGRSLTRIPIEQLEKLKRRYSWQVRKVKVKKGLVANPRRVYYR
tara:strand:- start:2810 stop:3322 length:513 start_codon:yes stop_codon:yes gene_type:complete